MMLGLMIAARHHSSSQELAGDADYTVNSVSEWNAVFANSAATLANKIVEVAAPIPDPVAISNRDFTAAGGPVTIRSANAGSYLGHLDLFTLVRGVDFSGLNFQLQGWPKAELACVEFNTGTFDNLRFNKGTTFRHGYGASLLDVDTDADLPEYERVNNVQTATTTSATYALTWKDPTATGGMIEFFNRGAQTVYVKVGGAGVTATTGDTACAAGARVRLTGLNPTTDTHFAILAASGTSEVNARTEIGLLYYMGRAFFASGSAVIQDIEIRNCIFRDLGDGVKGIGTPTSLIVMDNDFDRIYGDLVSAAPAVGGSARIMRNIYSVQFSRSGIAENLNGDAGDPHGDVYQAFGTGAGTISNIRVAGNRMRVGPLRAGVTHQGIFISDNDILPSYSDVFVVSETLVGGSAPQIATGEGATYPVRDYLIYGATIADYSNVANASPRISVATDQGGSVYIGTSVFPSLLFDPEEPQQDGNVLWSGMASPAAVFPNFANLATATTRAQIETALTTAAEGAGVGAAATANAIDWTTTDPEAVILWENVPSGAHWNALTNQAASTLITLPLRKILNKRANQAVSVGAGTEWQSVDTDGVTVIQAWTTASGTIQPGQFIQIRRTSSGTSSGIVTASVTINGFTQGVNITTAATPSAYLVQGATPGYFVDPVNVPSGTSRITFRCKLWLPTGYGLANLFTQESTGCDLQVRNSAGSLNATVEDSTTAKMLADTAVAPAPNTLAAQTWYEIEFDVNQVTQEVICTVNGVSKTTAFAAASTGLFQTGREVSFLANTVGTSPIPAGARIADMSVDFNGVRHKTLPNDAASANADPWKRGGNFTG